MKMHIMMLLMIFSACACNPPKIQPQERCTVSFTFDKCRCHMYDLMKQERVSDAYDKEISYCDDMTGFHADDWAKEITPWAKESRRYYEDTCK